MQRHSTNNFSQFPTYICRLYHRLITAWKIIVIKNILPCPVLDVLLDEPLPISRFFSLVPHILMLQQPLNNHLQASFFCTIAPAIYEKEFPFTIPIEELLLLLFEESITNKKIVILSRERIEICVHHQYICIQTGLIDCPQPIIILTVYLLQAQLWNLPQVKRAIISYSSF